MSRLTDTQLVILSAAAERDDRNVLPLPDTLKAKGGAATSSLRSLLKKELVEEHPAKTGKPAWREKDDNRYGLRITQAGLVAIGIDDGKIGVEAKEDGRDQSAREKPDAPSGKRTKAPSPDKTQVAKPSPGSKRATLIKMLSKPNGASVAAIRDDLGWLPHTVRAAITGLRTQGYVIDRHKGDDGVSIYRIVGQPGVQESGAARA